MPIKNTMAGWEEFPPGKYRSAWALPDLPGTANCISLCWISVVNTVRGLVVDSVSRWEIKRAAITPDLP